MCLSVYIRLGIKKTCTLYVYIGGRVSVKTWDGNRQIFIEPREKKCRVFLTQ